MISGLDGNTPEQLAREILLRYLQGDQRTGRRPVSLDAWRVSCDTSRVISGRPARRGPRRYHTLRYLQGDQRTRKGAVQVSLAQGWLRYLQGDQRTRG